MEEESLITSLLEDLRFCEEYLKKEVRVDLVLRILEELMEKLDKLREVVEVKEIEEKARILYHRAITLATLNEEVKK